MQNALTQLTVFVCIFLCCSWSVCAQDPTKARFWTDPVRSQSSVSIHQQSFVSVFPPDSSLWAPGTLLGIRGASLQRLGDIGDLGSRIDVPQVGSRREDAVLLSTVRIGKEELEQEDLTRLLTELGRLQPKQSDSLDRWLLGSGVEFVEVLLPDAQIHRLSRIRLHRLLADLHARDLEWPAGAHVVESALFQRGLELRFHGPSVLSDHWKQKVVQYLSQEARWRGRTLVLEGFPTYVAVSTLVVTGQSDQQAFSEGSTILNKLVAATSTP